MGTEYRRGIPNTAHVEAATRLGLLWHASDGFYHRFRSNRDAVEVQFALDRATLDTRSWYKPDGDLSSLSFRPIRPDGTPVDWEVLDQEVTRVGQRGQAQTMACNLTVPEQPQGFRADLWQALSSQLTPGNGCRLSDTVRLDWRGFRVQKPFFTAEIGWPSGFNSADILARWTVYQELKPLYDIVDGAQGEAAMPRDVEAEWDRQAGADTSDQYGDLRLVRSSERLSVQLPRPTDLLSAGFLNLTDDPATGFHLSTLSNFAAVLDAVAERRVAERMRGQTQAPTVTSAQPTSTLQQYAQLDVETTRAVLRAQSAASAPEPRRFADVRPDRHRWRWWRLFGSDCGALGTSIEANPVHGWRVKDDPDADWHVLGHYNSAVDGIRTVIPTDEQGNPVSWESIGQGRSAGQTAPTVIGRTATLIYVDDITTQAPSAQELRTAWDSINKTLLPPTQPPSLPRFTADELDDVDHSKTTKLGEVTLRRGKLPTVEQITKYREVRAKRTGGSVADALKESRIDCEVAQYVLERWAGGLGDADTVLLLRAAGCIVPLQDAPQHSIRAFDPKQGEVDRRSQDFLRTHNTTIDTSEKPSPTVQRERQEAEERRQRLASLSEQLRTERAANVQTNEAEPNRFDLLEPDPMADPAASIRAWEARRAAVAAASQKVGQARQAAQSIQAEKPPAPKPRPAILVVDAEKDGLTWGEAGLALLGLKLNAAC